MINANWPSGRDERPPGISASRLLVLVLAATAALIASASQIGAAGSWSIVPTPDDGVTLAAVSCPTALTCVAVGEKPSTIITAAAAVSNGGSWHDVPVPNASTADNYLQGISCISAARSPQILA